MDKVSFTFSITCFTVVSLAPILVPLRWIWSELLYSCCSSRRYLRSLLIFTEKAMHLFNISDLVMIYFNWTFDSCHWWLEIEDWIFDICHLSLPICLGVVFPSFKNRLPSPAIGIIISNNILQASCDCLSIISRSLVGGRAIEFYFSSLNINSRNISLSGRVSIYVDTNKLLSIPANAYGTFE